MLYEDRVTIKISDINANVTRIGDRHLVGIYTMKLDCEGENPMDVLDHYEIMLSRRLCGAHVIRWAYCSGTKWEVTVFLDERMDKDAFEEVFVCELDVGIFDATPVGSASTDVDIVLRPWVVDNDGVEQVVSLVAELEGYNSIPDMRTLEAVGRTVYTREPRMYFSSYYKDINGRWLYIFELREGLVMSGDDFDYVFEKELSANPNIVPHLHLV